MRSFEERKISIKPQNEMRLPDNTLLSSIFSNNDISNDFMSKLSLAKGRIEPGISSKIHFHPVITQTTYVLSGKLKVIMKGMEDQLPYVVALNAGESIITEPFTFFQLVNESEADSEVLYIVNPAFIFEFNAKSCTVDYNDAFVLDESWEELSEKNWVIPAIKKDKSEFEALRNASMFRFKQKTVSALAPQSEENASSLEM